MKLLLPRSSREDILGGLEYLHGTALAGSDWWGLESPNLQFRVQPKTTHWRFGSDGFSVLASPTFNPLQAAE